MHEAFMLSQITGPSIPLLHKTGYSQGLTEEAVFLSSTA